MPDLFKPLCLALLALAIASGAEAGAASCPNV